MADQVELRSHTVREVPDPSPTPALVRPWGVHRMQAFKSLDMSPPVDRMELDPLTQLTVYYDADGRVLEMKHRTTYQGTETRTATGDATKQGVDEDVSQTTDGTD